MRTNEPIKRCRPLKKGQVGKLESRQVFHENWVNISSMKAEKRREVWEHLQANKPDTAALLQDEFTQDMRKLFGAEICIPTEDLKDNNA